MRVLLGRMIMELVVNCVMKSAQLAHPVPSAQGANPTMLSQTQPVSALPAPSTP